MSSITLVPEENVDNFLQKSSLETVPPYISLKDVYADLTDNNPRFAWHSSNISGKNEVWVLCGLDDHVPLLVSHTGLVIECASRPFGTWLVDPLCVPKEYLSSRIAHTCDHKVKQYWAIRSRQGEDGEMGYFMKGIESTVHEIIKDAFELDDDDLVEELRKNWNLPDRGDRYVVEHPILAFPSIAGRREAPEGPKKNTLHPDIKKGLDDAKKDARAAGRQFMELSEVPGRPAVLYRPGSYHNPEAVPVECTEEDDWHRAGDFVWITGTIRCIINKTDGRYRGWEVEWWPNQVVRIARIQDQPPPHQQSRKRRANVDLKAIPLKRARRDMSAFPSPPKALTTRVDSKVFFSDPPSAPAHATTSVPTKVTAPSSPSPILPPSSPTPSPPASISSLTDTSFPSKFVDVAADEVMSLDWEASDKSDDFEPPSKPACSIKGKGKSRRA